MKDKLCETAKRIACGAMFANMEARYAILTSLDARYLRLRGPKKQPPQARQTGGDMSGLCAIGLQSPKTSANVGAALRACGVYGASMLAVSGRRYRRSPTDTLKQFRHTPFLQVDNLREVIPYGAVPVAVDMLPNAIPLPGYKHPKHAFYVFGPEDGTLGKAVTSWCRDIIFIPTHYCMNLAACVNVVLYDRLAKACTVRNLGEVT